MALLMKPVFIQSGDKLALTMVGPWDTINIHKLVSRPPTDFEMSKMTIAELSRGCRAFRAGLSGKYTKEELQVKLRRLFLKNNLEGLEPFSVLASEASAASASSEGRADKKKKSKKKKDSSDDSSDASSESSDEKAKKAKKSKKSKKKVKKHKKKDTSSDSSDASSDTSSESSDEKAKKAKRDKKLKKDKKEKKDKKDKKSGDDPDGDVEPHRTGFTICEAASSSGAAASSHVVIEPIEPAPQRFLTQEGLAKARSHGRDVAERLGGPIPPSMVDRPLSEESAWTKSLMDPATFEEPADPFSDGEPGTEVHTVNDTPAQLEQDYEEFGMMPTTPESTTEYVPRYTPITDDEDSAACCLVIFVVCRLVGLVGS